MATIEQRETESGRTKTARQRYDVRYRDANRRQRMRTFRTAADANAFAKSVEVDVMRGDYLDPGLGRTPFEAVAVKWYATTAPLKAKTRVGYDSVLRTWVLPYFAGRQVGRIETSDVRAFFADMAQKGAGVGTQRNARVVLRMVFATAVEDKALKSNPCDGVRLGRSDRSEMTFLELDQLHTLSDAMTRPEYGLLVRFTALTGLRAGEVAALRVGRLDLLRGRVEVAESASEVVGHGLVYGPPKTYERRSVPIPRAMCEELGFHLDGRAREPDAFMFTAPDGGPLRHGNFMARHFRPAVTAAGLPEGLRFHDLRHTCAALLINSDPPAHPLAVMRRLGHSSITITLDRYGHLFPEVEQAVTDSLDRAYRKSRRPA
jgi:integrase